MPSRLLLPFAVSLALHAGVLLVYMVDPPPAPPAARIVATLQPPTTAGQPADERATEPAQWLKNTLAAAREQSPEANTAPQPPALGTSPPAAKKREDRKRAVAAAQRKLSQHLYYPAEAVARGLEGEVRLLLILADDGRINEVHVAAPSGHPVLDQAAVRAARAMARVTWAHSRELILPVVFRLE